MSATISHIARDELETWQEYKEILFPALWGPAMQSTWGWAITIWLVNTEAPALKPYVSQQRTYITITIVRRLTTISLYWSFTVKQSWRMVFAWFACRHGVSVTLLAKDVQLLVTDTWEKVCLWCRVCFVWRIFYRNNYYDMQSRTVRGILSLNI